MKVTNTESWVEKAKIVHKNKYDYSQSIYTKSQEKIIIICPFHGKFEQIAVNHLSGYGCNKCGKKHNIEYFKKTAIEKHGDRYCYDKSIYEGLNKNIIITCKKHGDFTTIANVHLRGFNCPKCKLIDENTFIEKSTILHKGKYKYNNLLFKSIKDKVTITCPIHGDFEQRASAHLYGQGCPKCSKELNLHRKKDWIKKYAGKEVSLYVLKCWNDNEIFYKIGITGNIKLRYDSKRKLPYEFDVLKEIKSENIEYIWEFEKTLLKLNKNNRYIPKIKFGGSKYECFSSYVLE